MKSSLSKEVTKGCVCRFCEKAFVDQFGKPFCHNKLTICKDCALLPGTQNLKYNIAKVNTADTKDVWALRKSEILREIQCEVENDIKAFAMEKQIRREENKEIFDERWLPRFQQWMGNKIYWDPKKQCYTLELVEGNEPNTIDFYPKGNKVLIRKNNRWLNSGLRWLIKNILPIEFKDPRPDW